MYAPVLTYSDVTVTGEDVLGNTIHTTYHVDDNTAKFRFGARAGISFGSLPTLGWTCSAEGGLRPATDPVSGLYLQVVLGVSLNAKVF